MSSSGDVADRGHGTTWLPCYTAPVDDERDDRDIRDVLREEQSRGRRPVDPNAERIERDLREGFLKLIEKGTETDFRDALIALGWKSDSPEFEAFVVQSRALQRARRRP